MPTTRAHATTPPSYTFTNYNSANGLGNPSGNNPNVVMNVFATSSTIYAATYNGLGISADGGNLWTNRTTGNGLASNVVYGVDASGSTIYAATYGGLSIAVVPAPGALALLGAAGLVGSRRRR